MRINQFGLPALILLFTAGTIAISAQQRAGGGGDQGRGAGQAAPQAPRIYLTTTAFEDGGIIPPKYVGQMGVSPQLAWNPILMGTQSFVLLLHDPDVALQKTTADVTHWLVWNIPGTAMGLPEGLPQGAELPDGTRQVSQRGNGYMGPGAPANSPYHHYTFELWALDTKLDIPPGTPQDAAATRAAVMKAIDGHALGKAVLVGRFHQ